MRPFRIARIGAAVRLAPSEGPAHNARPTRCRAASSSCSRTSPGIVAWVLTDSVGDVMGDPVNRVLAEREAWLGPLTMTHGRRSGSLCGAYGARL